MRDSDKKLFSRFKRDLVEAREKKVVVSDEWVLIDRKFWEDNQKKYQYYKNLEEQIYGRVN